MKKLCCFIYCLIFSFFVKAQSLVQPEFLDVTNWVKIFYDKKKVKSNGCICVKYKNNDFDLEKKYCLEVDVCEGCKNQFFQISESTFFVVIPNAKRIGTDIILKDSKKNRSFCQMNFLCDSLKLYKYTDDLFCFNLYKFNELQNQMDIRYIFYNQSSGKLLKITVDVKSDMLLQYNIDFELNEISLYNDNNLIKFNFENMEILVSDIDLVKVLLTKTYFQYIKNIKRACI